MAKYLNPINLDFQMAYNDEVYVDKSMLIQSVNKIINTNNRFICVSRPRRFGKSTDANMLVAYYSKGCDSSNLFKNLKIAQTDSYQKYLNQYNVIHLNMQDFLSRTNDIDKMLVLLTQRVMKEIKKAYDIDFFDESSLVMSLEDIHSETNTQFIFIIDEWDCIFRQYQTDKRAQNIYLDFLRDLLKDQAYISEATEKEKLFIVYILNSEIKSRSISKL